MPLSYGGTQLLLHGDGADGSTTFTDVTGKTVTVYGNAQISTTQSKFGGAAMKFDGAGDYLKCSDPSFAFGSLPFTVELWFYRAGNGPYSYIETLVDFRANDNPVTGLVLGTRSSGEVGTYGFPAGTGWTARGTFIPGQFNHVAVVSTGGIGYVFLNGVQQWTGSVAGTNYTDGIVTIGGGTQGAYEFNGYIDDLRVTQGAALYTADFTPPAAPLGVTTGQQIVIQPHTTYGPPLSHYNPVVGKPVMQVKVTDLTDQVPYGINSATAGTFEFKGRGRITGTVKNTPATPVWRLLRLYREPGGLLVKSTWSHPDTGAYTFDGLAMQYRYTVVSFDHTQAFRAVIADRVIPEVIP
jgi:hypothetical protein